MKHPWSITWKKKNGNEGNRTQTALLFGIAEISCWLVSGIDHTFLVHHIPKECKGFVLGRMKRDDCPYQRHSRNPKNENNELQKDRWLWYAERKLWDLINKMLEWCFVIAGCDVLCGDQHWIIDVVLRDPRWTSLLNSRVAKNKFSFFIIFQGVSLIDSYEQWSYYFVS